MNLIKLLRLFVTNSFLSEQELSQLGLKNYGKNVLISRKASLYDVDHISIGNNVRIDDFCILSGNIKLGSFIHISAYTALYGKAGIFIDDFSGTSPRTTIFSAVDDFSGNYLINPMVPSQFTNISLGKVVLGKFVQLGANTVVMPDLTINEGAVTGVFSFVNSSLDPWTINIGIPSKPIKKRSKELLDLVKEII